MNKKKLTKATSGLLLTALMVGGAAAFLSTSQTGTKTNSIKIGQISIMFNNQQDAILLTDTYPMSAKYAAETLTPYTFDIVNDGDIDVDYEIYAVDVEGNIDAQYVKMVVDYAADGNLKYQDSSNAKANAFGYYFDGTNGRVKNLSDVLITDNGDGTYNIPSGAQPIYQGLLKAGESQTFDELRLYLNGANEFGSKAYVTNDTPNIQGESKKVQLVVIAKQDTNGRAAYQSTVITDAQGVAYTSYGTYATANGLSDEAKQASSLSIVIPESIADGADTAVISWIGFGDLLAGSQATTVAISGGANIMSVGSVWPGAAPAAVEVLDLSGMNLSAIDNGINPNAGCFENLDNLTTVYVGSEEDKALMEAALVYDAPSAVVEVKQ